MGKKTPKDKEIESTLALYKYLWSMHGLLKNKGEMNQALVLNFINDMDGIPLADIIFLLEDSIDFLSKMSDNFNRVKDTLEKEDRSALWKTGH